MHYPIECIILMMKIFRCQRDPMMKRKNLMHPCFPKLNWSAPKDSAWISTSGTLRCTNLNEVVLLFRASDSLVHDLCHAYDSCHDKITSRPQNFFLALRKWYPSLKPDMEFRCFVQNQKLVGISQREVTTFYLVLIEKKNDILLLTQTFFNNYVRDKFESENYTFDVYVTNIIIDFRIVEDRCGVRPGLKTAVPYDYLDTSSGSGWDQFLRNADEELRRQHRSTEACA
uniref:D123 n=1 Tax=Medicago truncatula TaxID=3880 RepID=A2Q2L5_MEDTR|nr:D123 [Medicago truncatula]